jgi:N6-L-threonylcarbamoyladenine synthase
MAGGVGANLELRARLRAAVTAQGSQVFFPRSEFCTDNAAMIAIAGLLRLRAGERGTLELGVRARWPLEELRPPSAANPAAPLASPQ